MLIKENMKRGLKFFVWAFFISLPLFLAYIVIEVVIFKSEVRTALETLSKVFILALLISLVIILAVELASKWFEYTEKKVNEWFGESG